MIKTETLKDGTRIILRDLSIDDIEALMKFYAALPPEDRKYLRVDVTNREIVEERLDLMASGQVLRIAALFGDEIIAEGALELSGEKWRRHQGELRVIVAGTYQHKGLGLIMFRELYFLAQEKKVELLVVKMMRPQIAAQRICRKLGFREEVLLPDYVRDLSGHAQDLVIMTCNMSDLWKEIDHYYTDSDWQRCQ